MTVYGQKTYDSKKPIVEESHSNKARADLKAKLLTVTKVKGLTERKIEKEQLMCLSCEQYFDYDSEDGLLIEGVGNCICCSES